MYTYDSLHRLLTANNVEDLIDGLEFVINERGDVSCTINYGTARGEMEVARHFPRNKLLEYRVFEDARESVRVITCDHTSYMARFYIKGVLGQNDRNTILFHPTCPPGFITAIMKFVFHLEAGPSLTYTPLRLAGEWGGIAFANPNVNPACRAWRYIVVPAKIKISMLEVLAKLFGTRVAQTICNESELS